MPSPFPGMDPYLEDPSVWTEFHGAMTFAIRAELNRILPPEYVARADRFLWVRDLAAGTSILLGESDSYVVDRGEQTPRSQAARASAAPATVVWPVRRKQGNRYIKIFDRRNHRVVTAIELLSPANKHGSYRRAYRRKRDEYLARGVHLVEIDLLRSGRRLPLGQPTPPPSDYYALVCRAGEPPQGGFWPISVRDVFPPLPIPLDPGVADVMLELRPCFDRVYEESRFAEEIDYSQPPNPPLRDTDAQWARELIAQKVTKTT